MGFTKLKRKDRANKYKSLVRLARMDGNEKDELDALRQWIGIAKSELTTQQIAEVLHFIYANVTVEQELADWIADTYGKEVN